MKNLNANFPDLKIELMTEGESDGLILLEQSSGGNIDRVAIHPIHIRHMAEKMGLIETNDPTARKTIAILARRMLALNDRIITWPTGSRTIRTASTLTCPMNRSTRLQPQTLPLSFALSWWRLRRQ